MYTLLECKVLIFCRFLCYVVLVTCHLFTVLVWSVLKSFNLLLIFHSQSLLISIFSSLIFTLFFSTILLPVRLSKLFISLSWRCLLVTLNLVLLTHFLCNQFLLLLSFYLHFFNRSYVVSLSFYTFWTTCFVLFRLSVFHSCLIFRIVSKLS